MFLIARSAQNLIDSEETHQGDSCRKCGGEMIHSPAIENTYVGIPDFPGDKYAKTLSYGGTGKLIKSLKCKECGWSVKY